MNYTNKIQPFMQDIKASFEAPRVQEKPKKPRHKTKEDVKINITVHIISTTSIPNSEQYKPTCS